MEGFEKKDYKVFEMFSRDWALATAGDAESFNTCTIGWGSLGSIWHRPGGVMPIVTVYVNPARYTWKFLNKYEYFTVSFFGEEHREALKYLGSHSGRDGDKVAAAGLTPKAVLGGKAVTFNEAELTFVCRMLYRAPFERKGMAEDIDKGVYKDWEPHWMYVGEIVETEDKREE